MYPDSLPAKDPEALCNYVRTSVLPDESAYQNYVVNVWVDGQPCVNGYGKARFDHFAKVANPFAPSGAVATGLHAVTCTTVTIACEAGLAGASLGTTLAARAKSIGAELFGCAIGAFLSTLALQGAAGAGNLGAASMLWESAGLAWPQTGRAAAQMSARYFATERTFTYLARRYSALSRFATTDLALKIPQDVDLISYVRSVAEATDPVAKEWDTITAKISAFFGPGAGGGTSVSTFSEALQNELVKGGIFSEGELARKFVERAISAGEDYYGALHAIAQDSGAAKLLSSSGNKVLRWLDNIAKKDEDAFASALEFLWKNRSKSWTEIQEQAQKLGITKGIFADAQKTLKSEDFKNVSEVWEGFFKRLTRRSKFRNALNNAWNRSGRNMLEALKRFRGKLRRIGAFLLCGAAGQAAGTLANLGMLWATGAFSPPSVHVALCSETGMLKIHATIGGAARRAEMKACTG